MMHPVVFDTAALLVAKGIRHVVLSPGSRNAPLTISLARHPELTIYNVVDERSAGFIALGMAQKLHAPVALCCTSGTALLNYAPAVAEAFYQEIPLIILSADRPSEWQGQRDGQTIRQVGALSHFVKQCVTLPTDLGATTAQWEYNHRLNEAINLAITPAKGPVHINIPFREPFYPAKDQQLDVNDQVRTIAPVFPYGKKDWAALAAEWRQYAKKLIIVGQHAWSSDLNAALSALPHIPVIADVISNVENPTAIRHHDLFLSGNGLEALQPDLVITLGKSVISKNLKLFLRKLAPKAHWHFDAGMVQADPFQSMTRVIQDDGIDFLNTLAQQPTAASTAQESFFQTWKTKDDRTREQLTKVLGQAEFAEFPAFAEVQRLLSADIDLHLANSMPVRYANFLQQLAPGIEVFCNRGTSGIDGTNGTAVGNALVSDRLTFLLTGDLSFFYDRNAFFHHHDIRRLKIVVFNNQGGGIFRLIDGPAGQPELERHFETRHQHSASHTAAEYGFGYRSASNLNEVSAGMDWLLTPADRPALLEIFTEPEVNQRVYREIKRFLVEG